MSAAAKEAGRGHGLWPALGAVALSLAPVGARAEQWVVENSLASRYESNDNASLAQASPGTMNTLSLSTALLASRKTESAATSLNLSLAALRQHGPAAEDRIDGQFGLAQSIATDPLNSLNLAYRYAQDFNNVVESADVAVARGRRRTQGLSGGWSRSLTERWSANTQANVEQIRYGRGTGEDYRNASLSAGLSFGWTEVHSVSLDASRARFRTEDGASRSTTDQVNVGVSQALSERNKASVSLGFYRTRTERLQSRLVCPLPFSFCAGGAFPFEVVTEPAMSSTQGLQFSLSERYQFDERTELALSVSRQQSPSGAGAVARSDALRASASRNFAPTASGSLSLAHSRSVYELQQGATARPLQQAVTVSLSQQLAPDLTLQGGYQFNRAKGTLAGQAARSNSLNISLTYNWPRLDATR